MRRSTSGEWNLSASNDLTSSHLEAALREAAEMDIFHVPCDEDEAEKAVVELKAMTSRPPWMDGEDAAIYEVALIEACGSYPIDVVRDACRKWRQVPQHGKWWPTEQDLRAQCEALFYPRKNLFNRARLLLQDLRVKEDDARRKNADPLGGDKGQAFRDAMQKRLRPARFDAYFHYSQIMFADRTISVRTQAAENVLTREGGDLLRDLSLRVVYNPAIFAKVRQPTWEDDTPAEREEVTRKFNRLKQAMAGGADLRALRAAGEV